MRGATLVLAVLLASSAHAQPVVRADSTRADSTRADTTRALPEPRYGAPPSGTPPPLRTRTTRGGPYNVVADRLEGGRTAAEGDVVTLIGNVTLSRAGTTVTSQMGRYVKRDGTIYLTGGVHAVDSGTRIDAIEAAYNETSDFLTLTGSVVVRDKDMILTGDYGSYDQQQGRAEIWNHVRGRDKGRTLEADRVTYLRDREIAQARGRVTARDSVSALTLTAESVDYDKNAQVARAMLNPKLVQRPKDGKGEVTLTGDTITVDSRERIAHAEGRVHVVQDSLEANAGRAVYFDRESRGLLLDSPRASTSEVTVKGDTLEVFTQGKALDRMRVHGKGAIDYRGGREGQTSTLTADRMEMWFSGDAIDSLTATENVANDFTGAPAEGKRPETNHTAGERMRLRFGDKELKQAIVTGSATGVYSGESAKGDSAATRRDRVEYEAGKITFEVTKNRIRLENQAHLSYQDLSLHSPEVVFDSKKQVFEARGNPVLEDKGDTLTGSAMAYDLAARKGAVFGARTRYETGWYTGEKIRRLGDSVLDVKGATYSTCNLLHPHYAFESDRMKIYLKDKIIARPVVFAVRGIPLLALPFYVFPIRDDRHSGILVPQLQFGFGSDNGFIRNAGYYWAANDYTDFTIAGDYYPAQPSLRLRGEARYKLLYKFEGQINGSYTPAMDAGGQNGGDLRATHLQQIGENTSLSALANFTSSADYTRDPLTGKPLANRIDRFLTSSLTLAHREPWAAFNLFLQRREDLDAAPTSFIPVSKVEDFLPTLSVALPTRTIGRRGVNGRGAFLPALSTTYLSFNARFVNLRNENLFLRNDSTQVDSTVSRWAYSHGLTLTDSRRLFGFINVGPSFRYNQVVFDEDRLGSGPAAGATWGLAGSASMTLYGTSHGGIGPIRSFRHVFNPTVTYGYQPDFPGLRLTVPTSDSTSVEIDRFGNVGGIGISGAEQSFVSFNVANRFELKVRQRRGEKTISNLLSVNLAGAYDFLYRRGLRTTPWQPVTASIRVQPPNYVSGDLTLNYDPMFPQALRSATASLGLRFSGGGASIPVTRIPLAGNEAQTAPPADPLIPWEASLSFSSGGSRGAFNTWNHTEAANAVLGISPTPNWQLRYYNQVDLTQRRIVAQEYALTRNLHCWNFQFVRRFSGGTADYYFRIGINARPEIYLDRGTTGIGGLTGLSGLPGISSFVP